MMSIKAKSILYIENQKIIKPFNYLLFRKPVSLTDEAYSQSQQNEGL